VEKTVESERYKALTLRELLKKTDVCSVAADMDIMIHGVCFDTRKLQAGDLFVAVRGFESDGHLFIKEAISKGAACVLCEESPEETFPHVLVNDTRKALATVSAAWFGFPASKLKLIGVTGTNGKTTVTTLIKQVVEKCSGDKAGLIGTNGNLIGDKEYPANYTTPESYEIHELLAMMVEEGCRYAIMEVSSHALYLSRVYGIEFDVGVFTNLSPDHQDFHASMEDYAKAKSLLFSSSRSAAINIDDEFAQIMIDSTSGPVFSYAINDVAADFVAKSIKLHSDKVDFAALTIGKLIRVEFPIPGMFSVYNAMAVIAASILIGFDIDSVTAALQRTGGVKGRAEVVPTGGRGFTVLIDYAHTPDALRSIIKAARSFTRGRVVTLFGCGGDRDKTKRPMMGAIAVEHSDFAVITSDNPRTEEPSAIIDDILKGIEQAKAPYNVIINRREAINWALENAQQDDILILAGKGHETYQIFGKDKMEFDEREVVAEYFSKLKVES